MEFIKRTRPYYRKSTGKLRSYYAIYKCGRCGRKKEMLEENVVRKRSLSCGCLVKDTNSTHGKSYTKIYKVWTSMLQRTLNPKCYAYKDYGGRGISVAEKWENFEEFYADMGGSYRAGLTLERIDNEKGYSKSNCKWDTWKNQGKNKRPSKKSVRFLYEKQEKTLHEWAKEYGINPKTLKSRVYNYKWDIKKALETPVKK